MSTATPAKSEEVLGTGRRKTSVARVRMRPLEPFDSRDVVMLRHTGGAPHDVVHAREHGLRELDIPGELGAVERVDQDLSDAFAVLGVVAISRYAHQTLHESVERIAPHEQAHPLSLPEAENADRHVEQLFGVHLQQRVPGIGLEDLEQGLAIVAGGRKPCPTQDAVDLAAQERNLPGADLVGRGRVKPEEAPLTRHLSIGAEPLDADVVQVRGPMHRGAGIGLREHENMRRSRERHSLGPERCTRVAGVPAQDAQPGVLDRFQVRLGLPPRDVVFAVTEECEVVLDQPFEELPDLGHLLAIDRRRMLGELLDEGFGAGLHRLPVLHRRTNLAQDPLHA